MEPRQESLTLTLHWLADGRERTNTVVCEDSPPTQLLPLLLAGAGLSAHAAGGQVRQFGLRLGAADGRPLRAEAPVSVQGVRSGGHLWLTDRGPSARRRCMLTLPDGSEVVLPPRGVALSRAWLLQLLALLNPEARLRELELLGRRESCFSYVSKRPHCTLAPCPGSGWSVVTARADVATLLNGARLFPEAPEPLGDGDRLTLGAYGPTLVVSIVEG